MFAEDAAVFLADFGLATSWSPGVGPVISGLMLLDRPDEPIEGGTVISREYEATFEAAAWPGLKRGEVLTIGGVAFKLRTDPLQRDDGVFSAVKLSKVAP